MIALLWLLGCTPPTTSGNECSVDTPCGWGETCTNGFCVSGVCATSAQCPIEHFCDNDKCYPGCRADTDCGPGTHCNVEVATCEPNQCYDTRVDCGYREYCDTTTGSCFDAGELFCRPCEEDVQCGEGNVCWGNYCGVNCNDRECPSGFDCLPIRDRFDNILSFQCLTYCAYYQ